MRRNVILLGALAMVLAAPAQAGGWKELRVRGVVVSASAEVVVVENAVGDAMLKCLVPEHLAAKASAFKPGDEVRMICARKQGRKAVLVKLEPLDAESKRHRGDEKSEEPREGKPEPREATEPREKSTPAAATARGSVVELAENAIVVQDAESGRRLACRVPAAKAHKLEGVRVGDRVKILCTNGELAHLERAAAPAPASAPEEHRLYGKIAAITATSVTVSGESRTLTCSVPGGFAERLGRFAVGDSVKMMCRGTTLTYLERVAATPAPAPAPAPEEHRLYGKISAISATSVTVSGERTLTCSVPGGFAERLGRFAVGDAVKMMCRGTTLTYLEKV